MKQLTIWKAKLVQKRVLLSCLFTLLGMAGIYAQQAPIRPAQLPAFAFATPAGGIFTEANLKKGMATVVLFFEPDCEHCVKQATWLREGAAHLPNTQYLWVSWAAAEQIAAFNKQYFGNMMNHHFVKDAKYTIDKSFGYCTVPTVLVFDKAGKFKKAYNAETAAEEIATNLK